MLAFPPDITFVIQLVSFFVLLVILNRLLFVPFSELLAARERSTLGVREAAARDQADTDALARTITHALDEARAAALSQADAIRRDAREREGVIFNEAKAVAAKRLAQLREAIAREADVAKESLHEDAAGLAQAMADAVLKRDGARTAR